jgi:predicted DNA-binding transcriptional regulator AlpA
LTDNIIRRKPFAHALGVSLPTLDRWQREGRIAKGIRIGPRSIGWRESYLKQFLAEREKAGAA